MIKISRVHERTFFFFQTNYPGDIFVSNNIIKVYDMNTEGTEEDRTVNNKNSK